MCKAKEYTEQLIGIYGSINTDHDSLTEELRVASLYEQDILHIIENSNFNAADGYRLAKMIKDNRNNRRKVKNELEPLRTLKDSFINYNMDNLVKVHSEIDRKDKILTKLSDEAIYNPRTEVVDGKVIPTGYTSKNIYYNKSSKPKNNVTQQELSRNFTPNAIIRTNSSIDGKEVQVLREDGRFYECALPMMGGKYIVQPVLKSKIKMI